MPNVQVSGVIPNTIRENTRPGEWVSGLALTGDTARLTAIELTGAAALNFVARWDMSLNLATLDVAAPIDFESFAAGGRQPQLVFGMRFVFDDGSRQTPSTTYRVAVIDEDDAPPSSLHFATGGTVVAGAIGSTIGTLAVTDQDSAGPFFFSFSAEDDWRFEVVGSTLKLRDGISLGLDEMPRHPLFINVSDGRQSAAFTLDLTVGDPGAQQGVVTVVAAETPQNGFSLVDPQRVVTLHEARDVTAATTYGEDIRQLMLAEGGEVWLPSVQKLQLADGYVDFDPSGAAVRAAALHALVGGGGGGGETAEGAALGVILEHLQAGQGWVELAAGLLPVAMAGLDDAGLVTGLYQAALERAPDVAELALQVGRLASGVARAQLVVDVAGSAEALAAHAAVDGHWVAQALGGNAAWHVATGGLTGGLVAAASSPVGEAWLF